MNTPFRTREDVQGFLHQLSRELGFSCSDPKYAAALDQRDDLSHLRAKYHIPLLGQFLENEKSIAEKDGKEEVHYLIGHSLGLQPKNAQSIVTQEMQKWAHKGFMGHFSGQYPWYYIEDFVIEESAKIIGALPIEVTLMNSVSTNLHLAMAAFYQPTQTRHKIIIEECAFSSDHFVVESQVRWHGYKPETSLVLLSPKEGERIWRTEDILKSIEEEGDSVAVILLSGVHYMTGHLFDMKAITEAGHKKGCYVGFDLAHTVGNVELELHNWGVDFAAWCTYKYLNTGPGGIGGLFLHEKYAHDANFKRLVGWWAHEKGTRLEMKNVCKLAKGAAGFQISNPPILMMACLIASLEVFKETSMKELCQKSRLLTGYLEMLLEENNIDIITSKDLNQRGCQLSITFASSANVVKDYLRQRGVVVDVREPNIIRVAPVPMYNSFKDVLQFSTVLNEALEQCKQ